MSKFTIEDLIKSIEVRHYYNSIPIENLGQEIEEWSGEKIPKETNKEYSIDECKFTGLNHVDFFIEWVSIHRPDIFKKWNFKKK